MKHSILLIPILCCMAFVCIQSCKKGSTSSPNIDESHLNQLFSELRTAPQNLTVTAGVYQTVQGANDTRLNFYPNSFKDANGNIITSGSISIQLVEMYKPGDMIANRASTTANGQLLQSGGQIYISATMNGQEVFANKYGIAFQQPAESGNQMELYYGAATSADSVISWTIGDTSKAGTVSIGTSRDSINYKSHYYSFDSCTKFHWVNCDHFYNSPCSLTDVNVVVPDNSYNASNTDVFIILSDFNCTMHSTTYKSITNAFGFMEGGLPGVIGLPIGQNYELVVVTNKNGSYYYFMQSGVVTNGMTINASMAPDTKNGILAKLASL